MGLTQANDLSKLAERRPVSKKYSISETKNTNLSYFTNKVETEK